MVESMIGLLRQDHCFTPATRCYECSTSDSHFPAVLSLSIPTIFLFPALLFQVFMSRNTPPCDTVLTSVLFLPKSFWGLGAEATRIFNWLLLAAKEAKTSSVCETYTQNSSSCRKSTHMQLEVWRI